MKNTVIFFYFAGGQRSLHCFGVHVKDQGQLYTNHVFFGMFMQKGRGNCKQIRISLVFSCRKAGGIVYKS